MDFVIDANISYDSSLRCRHIINSSYYLRKSLTSNCKCHFYTVWSKFGIEIISSQPLDIFTSKIYFFPDKILHDKIFTKKNDIDMIYNFNESSFSICRLERDFVTMINYS